MEYNKSEIFHFSKVHNDSNPELDLSALRASTLKPKTYWWYLGFYFDWCLSFKEHVQFYSTKALSTVKAMGMLGNSPSLTEVTSLLVLCCSYCNLWFSSLVLCWGTYQGTDLSSGNHTMQGCPLDPRCLLHFIYWWNWGSDRSHSHLSLSQEAS